MGRSRDDGEEILVKFKKGWTATVMSDGSVYFKGTKPTEHFALNYEESLELLVAMEINGPVIRYNAEVG